MVAGVRARRDRRLCSDPRRRHHAPLHPRRPGRCHRPYSAFLDIRDAPLLRPAAGERWPNNEKPCCAACCSSCRLREAQPRARSQDEISSFIDGVARRRTSAVSTNTRALSLDTLFDLMLDLSVKALCYLGTVCHDPLGFLQIRRDHQARAELARRTSGRESPRRNASSAAG